MLTQRPSFLSLVPPSRLALVGVVVFLGAFNCNAQPVANDSDQQYEYKETRELVALVKDAAELVRRKGEAAFADFSVTSSRWRQTSETYISVVDPQGNMLVHLDPGMEGKNELDLKDINGKPVIRGVIAAATTLPSKPEGWYHYEWPVPGWLFPRWKSTYARLVIAPSGKRYVVASGMYDDRMERPFVVDLVKDAVGQIEKNGAVAFPLFSDPTARFIAKDAYIFVVEPSGVVLVDPGLPSLEGRNLLDVKDVQGRQPIREMLKIAQTSGSGWVYYMQKSTYVTKAKMGNRWVLVGCGVYLERQRENPLYVAAGE